LLEHVDLAIEPNERVCVVGRNGEGKSTLLATALASGKKVIEAKHVDYAWDAKPILRDFSVAILRGDRVGIIGPNSSGKSRSADANASACALTSELSRAN